ncbi:glycerophosphodiester phosphodiesterase family protein [Anaerobacillus sp. MEB173]|uniref:glycerophosphodiester phosphodiesterase family protein n=1 Tax=Anaerobacillus sp. MEB173 TaxID=3383345 RepID=UPI003F90565E
MKEKWSLKKKARLVAPIVLSTSMVLNILPSTTKMERPVLANSQETFLVEENFDQVENQQLPEGWKNIQGNGTVINGKLVLTSPSTGSPSRVVIPLQENTGDYIFEADMTFKSAVENTRWASLMYRIQSENYPYYQFAIRRGTNVINGLEFAIRNEQNQWEVPVKTFYPEAFEYNKSYRLKVIAKDNRVQHFVNGQLVIDTDLATSWSEGDVGFQASGVTVEFDNVKLTSKTEALPPIEETSAFLPSEPETNILNAPTVITPFETMDKFNEMINTGISSIVLRVESNGTGELVTNGVLLSEVLQATKGKVIPILQVESNSDIKSLTNLLIEEAIQDVHVMSTNPDIVKSLKQDFPTARGAVIYTKNSLSKHDLETLAFTVHRGLSKVAVIPQKLLTPEIIHYLHSRTISVWGIGGNNVSDAHGLIHLGVDGIITENTGDTIDVFSQYPKNTIVQRPIISAHRGVPSLAPENTMVGYNLAYELGADQIETDVKVTKDGELIIMHDNTIDRTTTGSGKVSDLTLEEIRQVDAGIKFGEEFAGEKVPTFREFLQGFKGKDVVLLVELKDTGIEEKVIQEIKEEDMMNQVLVQSFDFQSVKKIHELAPEIGVGFLYSAGVAGNQQARLHDAQQMLNYAATINATLNASYGSISKDFITYMRQRGQLNLHWTFRNEQALESQLKDGLIGPITDYTQWLTDSPISLETPIKKRNLKVGKSTTIQAKSFVHYRDNLKENIETKLFIQDGEGIVSVEGNTVTAVSPGTANIFAVYTFTMLGEQWNLITEPIEVNVSE